MPLAAWKDILKRTYKRTWDDNVALVSAGVAFYGFFALLSLLGLIVLAYGFFADPRTVIDQMSKLTAILPTDVAVADRRAADARGRRFAREQRAWPAARGRGCVLRRHQRRGIGHHRAQHRL